MSVFGVIVTIWTSQFVKRTLDHILWGFVMIYFCFFFCKKVKCVINMLHYVSKN